VEAKDVLRFQLEGSFTQVRERVEAATDAEWDARAMPGTSKVGFVLWHCARTLDWAVNCALAGSPEVADQPAWSERLGAPEGLFGAGIPDAVADALPRRVSRQAVLEYLEEVRASALAWLEGTPSADLERPVDLEARLAAKPDYRRPGVWAEIESLSGIPAWQLLARPAISHIRNHMGEVDTQLAGLRVAAPAP
jgi:hypothetical protein